MQTGILMAFSLPFLRLNVEARHEHAVAQHPIEVKITDDGLQVRLA
jgi:hypothetical protein